MWKLISGSLLEEEGTKKGMWLLVGFELEVQLIGKAAPYRVSKQKYVVLTEEKHCIKVGAWKSFAFGNCEPNWDIYMFIHSYLCLCVYLLEFLKSAYVCMFVCVFI